VHACVHRCSPRPCCALLTALAHACRTVLVHPDLRAGNAQLRARVSFHIGERALVGSFRMLELHEAAARWVLLELVAELVPDLPRDGHLDVVGLLIIRHGEK